MSMETIVARLQEQLPDDWEIYVDEDGVLCVESPRDMTPEQNDVLAERWYAVTAAIPRPWESTYHVTVDDQAAFEKSSSAARRYGLKLVPTDVENQYQVLLDD